MTVTEPVTGGPQSETVTVYVVVTDGEATGFGQSVQLSPVAGDQEYVAPVTPLSPSCTDRPGQTGAGAVRLGRGVPEVDIKSTVSLYWQL